MNHDAILRKRANVTLRTVVDRIVRTFDRATAADIEAGARWYSEAGDLATGLGHVAGSRQHAAAVIAHLSPRTSWTRNVAGAVALCSNHLNADMTGHIGRNVDGARRALASVDGEAALATLGGPKTQRFAANILGDVEAVTVDVWAARVAGVSELELQRVGVYDALEHAYRLAARRRGVDPATMQATTWVVARGGRAS